MKFYFYMSCCPIITCMTKGIKCKKDKPEWAIVENLKKYLFDTAYCAKSWNITICSQSIKRISGYYLYFYLEFEFMTNLPIQKCDGKIYSVINSTIAFSPGCEYHLNTIWYIYIMVGWFTTFFELETCLMSEIFRITKLNDVLNFGQKSENVVSLNVKIEKSSWNKKCLECQIRWHVKISDS